MCLGCTVYTLISIFTVKYRKERKQEGERKKDTFTVKNRKERKQEEKTKREKP